ncbi:hypothetical protein [Robertmurraya korlensis]|nr:hypothetical protein [Robertmurraya korlensis]
MVYLEYFYEKYIGDVSLPLSMEALGYVVGGNTLDTFVVMGMV